MADLLQTGAAWLAGKFKDFASQTITYKRGLESVSLSATLGRRSYEQTDDRGITTQFVIHDFIITSADLTFGEPEKGDRIEYASQFFEVLDASGVNHFDYTDDYHIGMRIHTKRIG